MIYEKRFYLIKIVSNSINNTMNKNIILLKILYIFLINKITLIISNGVSSSLSNTLHSLYS